MKILMHKVGNIIKLPSRIPGAISVHVGSIASHCIFAAQLLERCFSNLFLEVNQQDTIRMYQTHPFQVLNSTNKLMS